MNNKFKLDTFRYFFDFSANEVGDLLWWQHIKKIGTPFIQRKNDTTCSVLFLWQDPQGNESQSNIASVLLDVNGVTDHHHWETHHLNRVTGTDVWFTELTINSHWRASYSFIPLQSHQLPKVVQQKVGSSKAAQRNWWLDILTSQCVDRFNQLPDVHSGWGNKSVLHLLDAEVEAGWGLFEQGLLHTTSVLHSYTIEWNSFALGNQRDCLLFSTGEGDLPLVILLDGEKWGEESGSLSVFQYLTETKSIAPARYLLIPAINNQTRWKELSCNPNFWSAIENELLPMVDRKLASLAAYTSSMLVAGQSLGGLSALYAGINYSHLFTKIISLSGSFWWPEIARMQEPAKFKEANPNWKSKAPKGSLAAQVFDGNIDLSKLHVFQTVGLGEEDMCLYNDMTYQAIQQYGGNIHYEKVYGGHDWLSWRSCLVKGIMTLIPYR